MKRVLLGIFLWGCVATCPLKAQNVVLKTNLFYGAYTLTPNLGVEFGLAKQSTLDIGAGYNPWNLAGSEGNNKKLVHLLGEIEYRYWLCEKFNGHFFGLHVLGASYNISQYELPLLFGKGSKNFRFQGWAAGAGVSYGYQFILGQHWNFEFNVGVGYVRLHYDKYDCEKCANKLNTAQRDYFGPTRGALAFVYTF